jgi:mannose-6-phosphate isomerase-like protein (cupin superfamily)
MTLKKKNFNKPDATQSPPLLRVDTIKIGEMTVMKQVFQPGWKWSKHMKPLAKTDTCQAHHFGVYVSGRMRVKDDKGNEIEFGPGDVVDIPPGHDGWVVGDEPAVFYGFIPGPAPK